MDQIEKVFVLRDKFMKTLRDRIYFPSQKEFSNKIIRSVILNEGNVLCASFTRQHGKTTVVTETAGFLLLFYFSICKKMGISTTPFFNIGFFAPQQQQAQTSFNMLKDFLKEAQSKGFNFEFESFNGDTITIIDKEYPVRQAYCFTASPKSHPESKTLNLIMYDESQDLDDIQIEKAISPMGSSTNATQVFIGVGGYRRCKYWKLLETLPKENKVLIPVGRALIERKELYEKTLNPIYNNYEKHIEKMIRLEGIDENSDHYKTQYLLQWILERGQFVTYEELMSLENDYEMLQEYTPIMHCYAGIDWGKMKDSTVVTVIDRDGYIIGWYEFLGDNYNSQIDDITEILATKYKGLKMVHCDATATQDMAVDMLRASLQKRGCSARVIPIKFTAESKDVMYKNLHRLMSKTQMKGVVIRDSVIKFPKNYSDKVKKEKFIMQFLDLQKQMKNERWSCNHPEGPQYHDDYCDSMALACMAFKPLTVAVENRFLMAY